MPYIKANAINIHYETFGSGTPLLLIGGYTQHKLAWKDYFEPLSKKFQVIAIDNRGCGQTDSPNESYSIKMFAQDTAAFMDELGIKNAHFMGQSMGTAIIEKICIDHPEKVRKAVLCAPFAKLPPISCHKAKTLIEMLEKGVDQRLLYQVNASWILSNRFIEQPGNCERFIDMIVHDPYPQSMEGLLGQTDALVTCDLRKELGQIPHEILLLVGEKDIATPAYCAKEIASLAKNTKTHVFKEMGHFFPWEIPDRVMKEMTAFLLQS